MNIKDKMLKITVFILSMIGILFIWQFLNYISEVNGGNIGLGNVVLIYIGFGALMDKVGDAILDF